jgi:hypothetical protein
VSAAEFRRPVVVDGEPVSLAEAMPRHLLYPPAVRQVCACGEDGTAYSHGGFTCAEVLEIRARVEAGGRPSSWSRILGGAR